MERYEASVSLAATYLEGRGITADIAARWRLGVVADPLPEHERQAGRLVIPYLTPSGVVDIKFRCLENHDCKALNHAKYDNLPGSSARLYGVENFDVDSPIIALVEGNPDTWVCTDIVGIPAVGVDGANKWRPWWGHCFDGYERVFVFQHGDDAGKKLSENAKANIYNAEVVVKPLPSGEDINSFVLQHGVEAFLQRAGLLETPA
ncbi:hypothetical protein Lesp01_90160 [Lentzea sp. NBRC 102530]|nr:hypothetical protein Lesp01_90160 [Lentzea sp. NBRC 102530]